MNYDDLVKKVEEVTEKEIMNLLNNSCEESGVAFMEIAGFVNEYAKLIEIMEAEDD